MRAKRSNNPILVSAKTARRLGAAAVLCALAAAFAVSTARAAVILPEETPVPFKPPVFRPTPAPIPAASPGWPASPAPPSDGASPASPAITPRETPGPRQGPIIVSPPPAQSGPARTTGPAEETDWGNDPWRQRPTISNRLPHPPPVAPAPEIFAPAAELPPSAAMGSDRSPAELGSPSASGKSNFTVLQEELTNLAKQLDWGGGRLAGYVEDADFPICILDLDAETPMTPASCQKLATLAAALDRLGADFQFVTPVEASGAIHDGALTGNLIVRGSGDPSLSARFDPQRRDVFGPFREWARRLKDNGLKAIQGHIIGDAAALDASTPAPGWPEGFAGRWEGPPISALTFNENLMEFRWAPGRDHGRKARYDLAPRFEDIQVRNGVKIDARGGWNWRAFIRQPASNLFDVAGFVPPRGAAVDCVAVPNPPKFFLWALKTALIEEKIPVSGLPVPLSEVAFPDVATSGSQALFTHHSPPLGQLAVPMLRYDLDLHAELLFLTLGRELNLGATFKGAGRAVADFLAQRGVGLVGSLSVDGSGLSRLNRLAPKQFVSLFKTMAHLPAGGAFFAAFPQGGQPGALSTRFQGSSAARDVAPGVFAVAGFLPGVHTLAGWTTTAGGRKLYFAFMLEGTALGKSAARDNVDQLVLTLAHSPLRAGP